MATRRNFLKATAAGSAAFYLSSRLGFISKVFAQAIPGGTLPPEGIPKYLTPLLIPPAMPRETKIKTRNAKNIDYYEVGVRQFNQQVLPAGYNPTPVWGYGAIAAPASFHFPSFTFEAKANKPVRVKWVNELTDAAGNFLPHLLPVDQTLHWANPGGHMGPDSHGHDPTPYLGPVPIVTHLHGAHTRDWSDGFPEAWYLPHAANLAMYHTVGSRYAQFASAAAAVTGDWAPGSATFEYPNDQLATTLWYHDHTLGMTRTNVYAGPAGFYLLRGGAGDMVLDTMGSAAVLPGPAPALGDLPGTKYYEIPMAIQDRSFNADGSLFYPASREFFDGATSFFPDTDVPPIWNPEFFGNTMLVNGNTWPVLDVEQRRYRFRLLNGCNSRFLILRMSNGMPLWQIGADQGFLAAPVEQAQLLMAPAERADVIVDFSSLPVGTEILMLNDGPDEPFGGGTPGTDFPVADPDTTGQVMKFRVVASTGIDTSTPPHLLVLPGKAPLVETNVRPLSLNEEMSATWDGPIAAKLGGVEFVGGVPQGVGMKWVDTITETPAVGTTEMWEFYNFTEDAHPIHVHLVGFEVVGRQGADGITRPPEAWESGFKDTVIAYPGEVTRVRATFDIKGMYVWHCHIIEHEDNEMMRPFEVV
jgi:FtsP/CotA-like multicopper oxidase with cupredoxin domain